MLKSEKSPATPCGNRRAIVVASRTWEAGGRGISGASEKSPDAPDQANRLLDVEVILARVAGLARGSLGTAWVGAEGPDWDRFGPYVQLPADMDPRYACGRVAVVGPALEDRLRELRPGAGRGRWLEEQPSKALVGTGTWFETWWPGEPA